MELLNFYNFEAVMVWVVFTIMAIIAKAGVEFTFRNPSLMLDPLKSWKEYAATFKFLRKLTTIGILITFAGLIVTIAIDTAYRLFLTN